MCKHDKSEHKHKQEHKLNCWYLMTVPKLYQLTWGAAAVSTHSRGKLDTMSSRNQLLVYCQLHSVRAEMPEFQDIGVEIRAEPHKRHGNSKAAGCFTAAAELSRVAAGRCRALCRAAQEACLMTRRL